LIIDQLACFFVMFWAYMNTGNVPYLHSSGSRLLANMLYFLTFIAIPVHMAHNTEELAKCVHPEGLAKELPEMRKVPKCLGSIENTRVLPISTCNFYATKNTPDAFKHVPDRF